MFQPQVIPFSSSSYYFSSLSASHGIDLTPIFGLPQAAHAGDGDPGPTNRGFSPQFLAHSNSHSGSPAGSLPTSCATAALHPQQHHLFLSNQRLPQHPSPAEASSSGGNCSRLHQRRPHGRMDEHNNHGMVAQQEAAKDYQPEIQGPLVGEKTPSHVITQEYAKADQIYVEKTTALSDTYSHYRPIQGDGNCGWRAIGFSYFEKLIEAGDQAQAEGEVARLKSLNHLLAKVGGYDYFEDFADEAFDLLREVASLINTPEAAFALVRQKWNDTSVQGSLIYYFRLLAATYLKANAATYEPFIPGGESVATYCGQNIEIVDREIEQLGIIALVNILLKPLNFVLEIAYLDRSPGSQVNRYRFPEEANEKDIADLGPIIYLLYRPDHYDILYRSSPVDQPVASAHHPINVQVNRVANLSHDAAFTNTAAAMAAFSTVDFGALSMIPGLSSSGGDALAGIMSISAASTTSSSVVGDGFSPSQQDPWITPYTSDVQSIKGESPSQPPAAVTTIHPTSQPAPLTPSTPLCSTSSTPSILPATTNLAAAGYPIRFSPHQLEYENKSFPEPTFQVTTNTFKNSVWNRAHYGNPDFQPEEWNPEEDCADNKLAARRKARKDS